MNLIEETLKLIEEDDDFELEDLPSLESVVREQAKLLSKNRAPFIVPAT